jgi:hypothetical protein
MRNRLNVDIVCTKKYAYTLFKFFQFASAVQCDPNFMVFNITKALLAGSFMKVSQWRVLKSYFINFLSHH